MLRRVDDVEPASLDGDCAAARRQSSAMGDGIDAKRKAADDGYTLAGRVRLFAPGHGCDTCPRKLVHFVVGQDFGTGGDNALHGTAIEASPQKLNGWGLPGFSKRPEVSLNLAHPDTTEPE